MTFWGCSSNKEVNIKLDSNKDNLFSVALLKFGKSHSLLYNNTKDYAVCIKIDKSSKPGLENLDFFIFSIYDQEIIYERNIHQGKIEWSSEYLVLITMQLGIASKELGNIRKVFYDVKKRTVVL